MCLKNLRSGKKEKEDENNDFKYVVLYETASRKNEETRWKRKGDNKI